MEVDTNKYWERVNEIIDKFVYFYNLSDSIKSIIIEANVINEPIPEVPNVAPVQYNTIPIETILWLVRMSRFNDKVIDQCIQYIIMGYKYTPYSDIEIFMKALKDFDHNRLAIIIASSQLGTAYQKNIIYTIELVLDMYKDINIKYMYKHSVSAPRKILGEMILNQV